MPSELKGVVLKGRGNSCTVFLENNTSKAAAGLLPKADNGDLVWVSYDYVHQKIIGLRVRNQNKENYYVDN